MKVSTILFVVISAAACLTPVVPQTNNWPKNCPSNPFRYFLRKNNVTLLETPVRSERRRCGEEWKQFGVCCNEAQLVEYAESDRTKIFRAVESVVESFRKIRSSYNAIRQVGLMIKKKETELLHQSSRSIIEFVRGAKSQDFGAKLYEVLFKKAFGSDLKHCWGKILNARSSALCSVCSGRSNKYFLDQRILLVESDCENILSECAPAFHNMVLIIEVLGNHFTSFQETTSNAHANFTERLEYLKNLTDTIKSEDIQQSIAKYFTTVGEEKAHIAGSLCSKFLNIKGMSFIEKLDRLIKKFNFKYLASLVSGAFLRVSNYRNKASQAAPPQSSEKRADLREKVHGPPPRVLNELSTPDQPQPEPQIAAPDQSPDTQKLPPLDSFFSGDVTVVVMNADSSYSSFLGALGSTSASHVGGKPFNITNKFP